MSFNLYKIKLTILLFLIAFVATAHTYNSINELKKQSNDVITQVIRGMLKLNNYVLVDNSVEIKFKPLSINIIANTNKGKKFLKLHDCGNGFREYSGAKIIAKSLPIVEPEGLIMSGKFELIIQPFIEQINQMILFNVIENLITTKDSLTFINAMFRQMANVINENLERTIKSALNDNLYINRLKTKELDNESGRIESFYKNCCLNLSSIEVEWEVLLKKQISIDGILYKETLNDLLDKARKILSPSNLRLISICHGDWHEMNTYVANFAGDESSFCFFDCEYSGPNDIIGDAIVYLIYNSALMAYLSPKYYPEQFKDMNGLSISQKNFEQVKREIQATIDDQTLYLNGVTNFGTSKIRKKITTLFIETYFNPLVKKAIQKFNLNPEEIEEKIKACILLRLIGVYNISLMDSMDQSKILGLIFKSIGTPVNISNNLSTLLRFKAAL